MTLLLIFAMVVAGAFAYYPWQVIIQPTGPKVIFQKGSNANEDDFAGSISVSLGDNGTSAKITVHPSYHVTYYKNVTLIKNTDNKAYYIRIRVVHVNNILPAGSVAKLYIYSSGATRSMSGFPSDSQPPYNEAKPEPTGYQKEINLTRTDTVYVGSLNDGGVFEVDVYVYIPEGASISGSSLTSSLYLIVSPTNGTPP